MKFPDEIIEVVQSACNRHRDDVPAAIEHAFSSITRLKIYNDWASSLVRQALQDLIYERRHQHNRDIKKRAGEYGGPAKVVVGNSKDVQTAHVNLYSYFIAGTTLGKLKMKDLEGIAAAEERTGKGYFFRATLLRKINAEADINVDPEAMVEEVIPEKKLHKIWAEAQEETDASE